MELKKEKKKEAETDSDKQVSVCVHKPVILCRAMCHF